MAPQAQCKPSSVSTSSLTAKVLRGATFNVLTRSLIKSWSMATPSPLFPLTATMKSPCRMRRPSPPWSSRLMGPSWMTRISKALSSSKSKCKPMLSPLTSAGTETLKAPLARTFSPSHSSSPLPSDGSVAAKANSVRGMNPLSSPLSLLRRTKPDSLTSTMLAAMPGLKIQAMARPPTSGPTTMAAAQTTTSPTSGRRSSRVSAARRAKTWASSKQKPFDKAFFSPSVAP
mmetsp:Transcript_35726/g.92179  ORF Transcript_35726/g.92179 Transcript_35726/m.92179 type:complete len:230 (+) Transcript_35726:157-846(+)